MSNNPVDVFFTVTRGDVVDFNSQVRLQDPQGYKEGVEALATRVFDGVQHDYGALASRIAPFQFTSSNGFEWNTFMMDPTKMDEVPASGTPRLLEISYKKHRDAMVRKGIAFEMEMDKLSSPEGRELFDRMVYMASETMGYTINHDAICSVINRFYTDLNDEMANADAPRRLEIFMKRQKDHVAAWASAILPEPLRNANISCSQRVYCAKGHTTFAFMERITADLVTNNPSVLDYNRLGPHAVMNRELGADALRVTGLLPTGESIYPIQSFGNLYKRETLRQSPLQRHTMIGDFAVMANLRKGEFNRPYDSREMNTYIYDDAVGTMVPVKYEEAVFASARFDEQTGNIRASVRPLDDRDILESEMHSLDPFEFVYRDKRDSDLRAKACSLMGTMDIPDPSTFRDFGESLIQSFLKAKHMSPERFYKIWNTIDHILRVLNEQEYNADFFKLLKDTSHGGKSLIRDEATNTYLTNGNGIYDLPDFRNTAGALKDQKNFVPVGYGSLSGLLQIASEYDSGLAEQKGYNTDLFKKVSVFVPLFKSFVDYLDEACPGNPLLEPLNSSPQSFVKDKYHVFFDNLVSPTRQFNIFFEKSATVNQQEKGGGANNLGLRELYLRDSFPDDTRTVLTKWMKDLDSTKQNFPNITQALNAYGNLQSDLDLHWTLVIFSLVRHLYQWAQTSSRSDPNTRVEKVLRNLNDDNILGTQAGVGKQLDTFLNNNLATIMSPLGSTPDRQVQALKGEIGNLIAAFANMTNRDKSKVAQTTIGAHQKGEFVRTALVWSPKLYEQMMINFDSDDKIALPSSVYTSMVVESVDIVLAFKDHPRLRHGGLSYPSAPTHSYHPSWKELRKHLSTDPIPHHALVTRDLVKQTKFLGALFPAMEQHRVRIKHAQGTFHEDPIQSVFQDQGIIQYASSSTSSKVSQLIGTKHLGSGRSGRFARKRAVDAASSGGTLRQRFPGLSRKDITGKTLNIIGHATTFDESLTKDVGSDRFLHLIHSLNSANGNTLVRSLSVLGAFCRANFAQIQACCQYDLAPFVSVILARPFKRYVTLSVVKCSEGVGTTYHKNPVVTPGTDAQRQVIYLGATINYKTVVPEGSNIAVIPDAHPLSSKGGGSTGFIPRNGAFNWNDMDSGPKSPSIIPILIPVGREPNMNMIDIQGNFMANGEILCNPDGSLPPKHYPGVDFVTKTFLRDLESGQWFEYNTNPLEHSPSGFGAAVNSVCHRTTSLQESLVNGVYQPHFLVHGQDHWGPDRTMFNGDSVRKGITPITPSHWQQNANYCPVK